MIRDQPNQERARGHPASFDLLAWAISHRRYDLASRVFENHGDDCGDARGEDNLDG
jgi:hypothetical protein